MHERGKNISIIGSIKMEKRPFIQKSLPDHEERT